MNELIFQIVVHTANILGIFSDPFEFDGDYGPEANATRKQVFELVVSREALAKNLPDAEIRQRMGDNHAGEREIEEYKRLLVEQAVYQEKEYGPTLGQLVTPELLKEIKKNQNNLDNFGFTDSDFLSIINFIECYSDKKIFRFLRNAPPELLALDKSLRDNAAREGKSFNVPVLGSTQFLEGNDSFDLKINLIRNLFTKEVFKLTKNKQNTKQFIEKLDSDYLKKFLDEFADNQDLEVFSSPLGQVFFYWMYHSLNLELVSSSPEMIDQINKVKNTFACTLGDPIARANTLKERLISSNSGVFFTQESDALVSQILTQDGVFLPVDRQNAKDGTLIFLRSDLWDSNYEIIPIEGYVGYKKGKINVILATNKYSGQKFLLASCHGNSTQPEDARLQITLVIEKFHQLSEGNLQLFIGIDANTKTEEDVNLFKEHLDKLGLVGTEAGPTTVKKRMVTVQHSKAGRLSVDQEDYLITLRPECGGQFKFNNVTVGFLEEKVDINKPLPNIHNPSDHYPVGAVMDSATPNQHRVVSTADAREKIP